MGEGVVLAQVLGDVEGDRDRVVGELVDARHRERVERGAHSDLKWSNGSRQDRHTHNDLHAVDPNRLDSAVSRLPHCGQRTESVSATVPSAGRFAADGRRERADAPTAGPLAMLRKPSRAG